MTVTWTWLLVVCYVAVAVAVTGWLARDEDDCEMIASAGLLGAVWPGMIIIVVCVGFGAASGYAARAVIKVVDAIRPKA